MRLSTIALRVKGQQHQTIQVSYIARIILLGGTIITPRAHAQRGVMWSVVGGVYKSTLFLEPIFYLSKYSLSELYFNTDRLLIEFNGLWYSLAARQVFVAIANPDSLSFG